MAAFGGRRARRPVGTDTCADFAFSPGPCLSQYAMALRSSALVWSLLNPTTFQLSSPTRFEVNGNTAASRGPKPAKPPDTASLLPGQVAVAEPFENGGTEVVSDFAVNPGLWVSQ